MGSTDEAGAMPPRRIPLLETLAIRSESAAGGRSRVEVVVAEGHLRSKGIAHGGLFATLLDTAMGWAVASMAPEGVDLVTAQLSVNFLRPARLGDRLIATGTVEHDGRKTAVARGEVRTASGDLAAIGTATFLYVSIPD